jgi:hypothetical protein
VVSVRATGLISLFHLACYLTTHLIGRAAGLPVPRGLYFLFHDWAEPPLRRWCERHPNQHWQPDGR